MAPALRATITTRRVERAKASIYEGSKHKFLSICAAVIDGAVEIVDFGTMVAAAIDQAAAAAELWGRCRGPQFVLLSPVGIKLQRTRAVEVIDEFAANGTRAGAGGGRKRSSSRLTTLAISSFRARTRGEKKGAHWVYGNE